MMKTALKKDPFEGVQFEEIAAGELFWTDGGGTQQRGLYLRIDSGESEFAAEIETGMSWAFKSKDRVFRVEAEELKFSIVRG